ncbi:hypothetical protein NLJ89_g2556 [Agrocybe chaxingu]|uniref:Uncharacterized protein n=1 Tax=Agrocybe chaxingu TaxID=84603 RepID=A0A9W8K5N6_9AGAR|nr:hypothetical protein NLJ89_g2556 [Agrocybe chaxingu]
MASSGFKMRKLSAKVAKSVMKSHRLRIPKYEMPIRLRPYKEFQFGDIVANILGSIVGLCVAFYLERYYRHRREIARLYRPLSATASEFSEDEDEESGTQLLPRHSNNLSVPKGSVKKPRLADVWDDREELFGVGEDSDDEGGPEVGASRPVPQVQPPRIVISHS